MQVKSKTVSSLPFNLSPKAVLAFLFPLIAAVVSAVILWLAGGEFDITPIRLAVGGLLTSGLALLGAYIGSPAAVVHSADEERDLHEVIGA